MKILLSICLVLCCIAQTAISQTVRIPEVPALSVSIWPQDAASEGVYVQQQIVMRVQVASRHPFDALDLDVPRIDGAEVIELARPRTRQVRSYAGAGHVHEVHFAIFPERSGTLEIAPIRVEGTAAGAGGAPIAFTDSTPELRVPVAEIDPGFEGWWVVSERIEISETWSKPLEEVRFGETVRREVTVTAFDVTAERVPQLSHGQTQRVVVTDAGGTSRTAKAKDGVFATVVHAWDLRIDGEVVLYFPPVSIEYWDPVARAPAKAHVSGHRIEPLPADHAAEAARLMAEAETRRDTSWLLGLVILAIIMLPAVLFGAVAVWLMFPTRADRTLRSACGRAASPEDCYRAVEDWIEASAIDPDDPALVRANSLDALRQTLFAEQSRLNSYGVVASELSRFARRRRLAGLGQRLQDFAVELLGPRRTLEP